MYRSKIANSCTLLSFNDLLFEFHNEPDFAEITVFVMVALLGRPEPPFPTGLCFTPDVFFGTLSPRPLDRPRWNFATWSESAVFYKLTSKIRGVLPQKIRGPKTWKISVNFGPLQTLTSNISGTRQHIQNRKDVGLRTREIPPAFDEKVRWTLVH